MISIFPVFVFNFGTLGTFADLQKRRAAPMPPEIAAKFDVKLSADQQLNWEAPVSGVIKV